MAAACSDHGIPPQAPPAAVASASTPGIAQPENWLFEENRGQFAPQLRFVARRGANQMLVQDRGFTIASVGGPAAALDFVGARPAAPLASTQPASAEISYPVGGSRRARIEAKLYPQLRQTGIYDGIDLVYYSRKGQLQFDFVVQPGARPEAIALRSALGQVAQVGADGALELRGPTGNVRLKAPLAYQVEAGSRVLRPARWTVGADQRIGFKLGGFNAKLPLVIDPIIELANSRYISTGIGNSEEVVAVARENIGGIRIDHTRALINIERSGYVCAPVQAPLPGGLPPIPTDGCPMIPDGTVHKSVVMAKFTLTGDYAIYTLVADGAVGTGMAVAYGADWETYITGTAVSPEFSPTENAFQRTTSSSKTAFFAVVSAFPGRLEMLSYYGGAGGSHGQSIAATVRGRFTLAGTAGSQLPTTAGSYMPALASGEAGFVAQFDIWFGTPSQMLRRASYYGAAQPEANRTRVGNTANAVGVDREGRPWIAGEAFTTRLPLTANASMARPVSMDADCVRGSTSLNSFGYVARLSADLSALEYASYISGYTRPANAETCGETLQTLAAPFAGSVYVGGTTASRTLATTAIAAQALPPGTDAAPRRSGYVVKLDTVGRDVKWATYLGGDAGNTTMGGIAVEYNYGSPGLVWATLTTAGGSDFPAMPGATRLGVRGASDAMLVGLSGLTGALRHASVLAGEGADAGRAVALDDQSGDVFVVGSTASNDFPTAGPAGYYGPEPASAANTNGFLSRFSRGVANFSPRQGGNAGDVTLTVDGEGADSDAQCVLTLGSATVTSKAARTTYVGGGYRVQCLMALKGVQAGAWTLKVRNADGREFLASNTFEVLNVAANAGAPEVWASIVGPSVLRTGGTRRLQLNYGNRSANNVYMVPIWLSWPASSGVNVAPSLTTSPRLPNWPARANTAQAPIVVNGRNYLPLMANRIPAGDAVSRSLDVEIPRDFDGNLDLRVGISPPWPTKTDSSGSISDFFPPSPAPDNPASGSADLSCLQVVLDLVSESLPGAPCVKAYSQTMLGLSAQAAFDETDPKTFDQRDLLLDVILNTADCGLSLIGGPAAVAARMGVLLVQKYVQADHALECLNSVFDDTQQIPTGQSVDPNFKAGPRGDGSAGHQVASRLPFNYVIGFENQPSASLPAAVVRVTDQLDLGKFDARSLSLGSISWGPYTVAVPPGLQSYSGLQRLSDALAVRIAAEFDPNSGLLAWTLETIDPQTGLPPSDGSLGFLPPNRNGTEGQGYLTFTVALKKDLTDGTAISNAASIVFDANAPIVTPAWVNRLDLVAPTSRVTAASLDAADGSMALSWEAADSGSGVRAVAVYLSEDGGAFRLWRQFGAERTARFEGAPGKRYAFHARATDVAGNVERVKFEADVSVSAQTPEGGSTGGGATGPFFLLMLAAAVALLRPQGQRPA